MKVTITNPSGVPAVIEHGVKSPTVLAAGASIDIDVTLVAPVIVRAPENLEELEAQARKKPKQPKKDADASQDNESDQTDPDAPTNQDSDNPQNNGADQAQGKNPAPQAAV